ncbi:MAG: PadR family transcriptional regulator [Acidobacteriota bacterium]
MKDKELYSGFIRLHILHHACEEAIYGVGIIRELGRHGYTLSPGTLYPILHAMEKKGYLKSYEAREGKEARRFYRATSKGQKVIKTAKIKVKELFGELFETDSPTTARNKKTRKGVTK